MLVLTVLASFLKVGGVISMSWWIIFTPIILAVISFTLFFAFIGYLMCSNGDNGRINF